MNWFDDFEKQLEEFLNKYFQIKKNFMNLQGGGYGNG